MSEIVGTERATGARLQMVWSHTLAVAFGHKTQRKTGGRLSRQTRKQTPKQLGLKERQAREWRLI